MLWVKDNHRRLKEENPDLENETQSGDEIPYNMNQDEVL